MDASSGNGGFVWGPSSLSNFRSSFSLKLKTARLFFFGFQEEDTFQEAFLLGQKMITQGLRIHPGPTKWQPSPRRTAEHQVAPALVLRSSDCLSFAGASGGSTNEKGREVGRFEGPAWSRQRRSLMKLPLEGATRKLFRSKWTGEVCCLRIRGATIQIQISAAQLQPR